MLLPKLIGQFNRTVRTIRSALNCWQKKKILEFLVYRFKKGALYITNFVKAMINW